MQTRYPVYIISKGRWESRHTSKYLEYMNMPYKIVIEPQEFENYSSVIDKKKILVLPFSNLGQGSIPARNWVWEHSISIGAEKHWILDDNIDGFFRFNNNLKVMVDNPATFCAAEDFTDRYKNVKISGMNYFMFAPRKTNPPPYYLNTRIYSCILLSNDLKFRWRGKYNEDTDLSIRILKEGFCSILFNTFLCRKITTMTMGGGNTDVLYKQNNEMDGRYLMAKSLKDQHPEIVKITQKWGRYQHHVDYSSFKKNKLIKKKGLNFKNKINNYGMFLKNLSKEEQEAERV